MAVMAVSKQACKTWMLWYQILFSPAESQERMLTSLAQFLVLLPLWLEEEQNSSVLEDFKCRVPLTYAFKVVFLFALLSAYTMLENIWTL